jgi:hypothetical protein
MKGDTYEKIKLLKNYYELTRKAGHTRLMKQGTKNYEEPFFIITPTMNYNGEMECKPDGVVSWNNLKKLYGSKRPIAFDNSTLGVIFEEITDYIEDLQRENEKLKRTLKIYIES